MRYICRRSMQGVRRAVFLLTAIAMVFSIVLSDNVFIGMFDTAAADDAGDLIVSDFRLWIGDAEVGADTQPTVKDGDNVELAIKWRINNNDTRLKYETVITSAGISFNVDGGELYSDGEYIGTYSIQTDTNGVTTFSVELTPEARDKSNIGGGALLQGKISLDADKEIVNGSTQQITAGDKSFTVIYDDKSGHGSVDLSKSNTGISVGADGKFYAEYTITATVKGMIKEFVLDDILPEGVVIVGDITVEGGSTNDTSFPFTIETANTKKTDSSAVTVKYKTEIPEDVYNAYASKSSTTARRITNTAEVKYNDDTGEPKEISKTSSVTPAPPSIYKSSSSNNKKSGELEWVKGKYSRFNNSSMSGGALADENASYYVVEWTININPGDAGDLSDPDVLKGVIKSIKDTMKDNSGNVLSARDWVPYHIDYVDVKSNDMLSEMLYRYGGDLSQMTDAEYSQLIASGSNFVKQGETVALKYKTVIVGAALRANDSNIDRRIINNTVDATVENTPVTYTGTAVLDLGIDLLEKDIELDLSDKSEVTKQGSGYSDDWENGSSGNVLKKNKDLQADSSGIYEVPFRVVISAENLSKIISNSSTVTMSDSWELQDGIPHHYISNQDEFWNRFKIYYFDSANGTYTETFARGLFKNLTLTGATTLDGATVYTGWTADVDTGWLNYVLRSGKDIVMVYCTKVRMVKDANGKYVFDPEILENGAYDFSNTVTMTVTNQKTVITDNDSFTLSYTPPESEPEFGNIEKKYIAGSCGYKDTGTFSFTDKTQNRLGWCITIPTENLKAGDKLVISDDLPEGMSLVDNPGKDITLGHGLYTSSTDYDNVSYPNITYADYRFDDYSIVSTDAGFEITINVTQAMLDKARALAGNGKTPLPIRIYYVTSYDASYVARQTPDKTVTFTNTATATINGDDRQPVGDSATVNVPDIAEKLLLTQDISQIWNERDKILSATYSLDINIGADDLDTASDTLTVIDSMADCMEIVEDSIVFTDASGNMVAGCSYSINGSTTEFKVPDGKHIIITYSVIICADPISDPFWWKNVINTFSINGFDLDEDVSTIEFADFTGLIRAWAYNTKGSITLYKYYAGPQGKTNLQGAQFVLRRVYDNNGICYPADDVVGEVRVTDENGEIVIDDLPLDMIYMLEEVGIPEGYADEHKSEFYFMLNGDFKVIDPRTIDDPDDDVKEIADRITAALGQNDLPVYEDAGRIEYENVKLIDIDIEKTWKDYGHSDYRPGNIEISLRRRIAGGEWEAVAVPVLSWTKNDKDNTWKCTIKDLRAYDKNGKEYIYEVSEKKADNYLDPVYSGSYNQNIVNALETVDISVQKNWFGDDDHSDKYRPKDITVQILADGAVLEGVTLILNESNNWRGSVDNLPKYTKTGKKIAYTVKEIAVTGYSSEVKETGENSFIINNTFETVDLTVTKLWLGDEGYDDEYRPEQIKVQVLADGKELDGVILTLEKDSWSGIVYDLPKYDTTGKEIVYTVKEIKVAGYDSDTQEKSKNSFIISNTFETVDLTVTKLWLGDEGYADEYRPESITVQVLANNKVLDGVTLTLEKNGWAGLVKNLPKYDKNGEEITYTLKEQSVTNYSSEVKTAGKNSFIINNSFETVELDITKNWIGDEKYYNYCRPEEIEVVVLADGSELDDVSLKLDKNSWSGKVTGLPKYDKTGKEITYTVKEMKVVGYSSEVKESGKNTFIINNTLEDVSVSGTKTWQGDESFADVIRPEEITIVLYANDARYDSVTCTAEDGWEFTFDSLPKYDADGEEIVYTIGEEDVAEGYIPDMQLVSDSDDEIVYSVLNTFTEELTEASVVKTWDDNGNAGKTRPESITVQLFADGEQVMIAEITAEDNATGDNEWTYTFFDLPKYSSYRIEGGKIIGDHEIVYTAAEDDVEYYDKTEDGLSILNTLHNEETSVSGTKVWEDNGNKDKTRPDAITVILCDNVNGELDCLPVWDTETDPDNWAYTFSGLPVYAYVDGERIMLEYCVTEKPVSGYTTEIDGTVITNTLITTDLTVNKLDVAGDEEIAGAKLELYDENGAKIGEWISAKDATWDVGDLIPGRKYTIKESETPVGYETAEDTVFTVDEAGRITILSGKDASIGENGELIINDTAVKVAGDDDSVNTDLDTDNDNRTPTTEDMIYPTTAIIVILVLTAVAVKKKKSIQL